MPCRANSIPCLLLIFIFLIGNTLHAQYTPYFENYALSEHNAGNQNWGVSMADDGKIYFANDNGLLVYDGLKWSLHEIPNKTTLRSVYAHDDRVYIGSYQEFGYWEKNQKGRLKYVSLGHLLDQNRIVNEEFWQIFSYRDAIVFRSFQNIYFYKDHKIISLQSPSVVLSCDIVDDVLYVSTLNKGIFILKDNYTFEPYFSNETFQDIRVVSINKLDAKLFITTSLKGCFTYDGNSLKAWDTEINAIVKEQQLNTFSMLDNGKMVFGTIKNGVYITDKFGNLIYHISKENGLMNNTILDQMVTSDNEVWLGLDNGVASISLNSPHTFYNDITGKLGAVYCVTKFDNTIYIGSNTGLYYLDKNNELQFVEDSQGQVWELKEIDGQLFCGHNNGTYLVNKNNIRLIDEFTGGWVLKKLPESNGLYIQGNYTGIAKFQPFNSSWSVTRLGGTTMPIRFMALEDKTSVWTAHAYKGLYKMKIDVLNDTILEIKDYGKKGLITDYKVRVYKLKSDICFKTNDGWYKYEPLLDTIVPFQYLDKMFGKDAYIISDETEDIFALKNKEAIEFRSLSNPDYRLSLPDKYFKKRLVLGNESISKINDSVYSLSLNDGFMLIDAKQTPTPKPLQAPIIESVEVDTNFVDFSEGNIKVPYRNKSIAVWLSSPYSRDYYFEYALSDTGQIHWLPTENGKLELSNLNDGEYRLLFRTSDATGNASGTTSFRFTVLPPWYKTTKGFLLLVLLFVLVTVLFYVLHKRKIRKEQKLLKVKFEKEQELILKERAKEQERHIVELKNEALKNEVKLKSKQLANTAMALVKKNEALMELKSELMQNKSIFDNPFSYKKIVKKIDQSIGHKDEWKLFEHNFNQVHEEFFNGLKAKYPELTHKDLKICAYIKMNLTTKEIAPLLNISTRGVETHRYRLKRKLNLDSDKNLTEYLVNFK